MGTSTVDATRYEVVIHTYRDGAMCRSAWIFGPEAPYERNGDVGNVTFPCGYTLGADGDAINLYYGAADTSIALASGSVRHLLGWLDEHGRAQ
jgi:predicted GH43/DUF377 family glycosyl hydrolase